MSLDRRKHNRPRMDLVRVLSHHETPVHQRERGYREKLEDRRRGWLVRNEKKDIFKKNMIRGGEKEMKYGLKISDSGPVGLERNTTKERKKGNTKHRPARG